MSKKTGFYLLDNNFGHPTWNSHRQLPDRTRSHTVNKIVLHDPEAPPGIKEADLTAERVAKYAASLTRPDAKRRASYHVGSDSDSIIRLLPDEYRAWHVHRYSQSALGIEMGYRKTDWRTQPKYRVSRVLENAARVCAYWAVRHAIPVRILTKEDVDNGDGVAGFSYHGYLDPARRTDPGVRVRKTEEGLKFSVVEFPATEFFERVERQVAWQRKGGPRWPQAYTSAKQKAERKPAPVVKGAELKPATPETVLADILEAKDGSWREDRQTVRGVQRLVGADADGIWGPKTEAAAAAWARSR